MHAYAHISGMILRPERTIVSEENSKTPSGRLRFSVWLRIRATVY